MLPQARDIEVSDDNLTMSAAIEDAGIAVKQLAMLTGRSAAQVYRYLSGEATIPSIVWRVIYSRTRDYRILQLITGDMPVLSVPFEAPSDDLKCSIETLIRMRRAQIAVEQDMLNIFADGKIDGGDRQAIERFRKEFPRMLGLQSRIYAMIAGGK
jgi:hypothetical protein